MAPEIHMLHLYMEGVSCLHKTVAVLRMRLSFVVQRSQVWTLLSKSKAGGVDHHGLKITCFSLILMKHTGNNFNHISF